MSNVRIYYSQDEGIGIGTIFEIQGIPYIVYSQDALESEVYYTSIANRCNTSLIVQGIELPIVLVQDSFTVEKGTITTDVAGKIVLYTQQNEYADQINVNDQFRKFGNVYSVGNKFSNYGLQYLYMEQELFPHSEYSIEYYGDTTLFMDEVTTYQMRFVVMDNNAALDPQPPLTYTSSDSSVASIDTNGLLTLHSPGSVSITCTCSDPDVSRVIQMTIGGVRVRTYSITALNDTWYIGASSGRTFTLHTFDPQGNEDTDTYLDNTHTYLWTVDAYSNYVTWQTTAKPNQMKGTIGSSIPSESWGETITVYASLDGDVVAQKEMTIQRL